MEYVFEPPINPSTATGLCAAVLDVNNLHEVKEVLKGIKKNPDMVTAVVTSFPLFF